MKVKLSKSQITGQVDGGRAVLTMAWFLADGIDGGAGGERQTEKGQALTVNHHGKHRLKSQTTCMKRRERESKNTAGLICTNTFYCRHEKNLNKDENYASCNQRWLMSLWPERHSPLLHLHTGLLVVVRRPVHFVGSCWHRGSTQSKKDPSQLHFKNAIDYQIVLKWVNL